VCVSIGGGELPALAVAKAWIVAYPDRTAFFGDYFRIGGDSPGTETDSSGPRVSIRLPTRELAI
jgi:hypothetical protein